MKSAPISNRWSKNLSAVRPGRGRREIMMMTEKPWELLRRKRAMRCRGVVKGRRRGRRRARRQRWRRWSQIVWKVWARLGWSDEGLLMMIGIWMMLFRSKGCRVEREMRRLKERREERMVKERKRVSNRLTLLSPTRRHLEFLFTPPNQCYQIVEVAKRNKMRRKIMTQLSRRSQLKMYK